MCCFTLSKITILRYHLHLCKIEVASMYSLRTGVVGNIEKNYTQAILATKTKQLFSCFQ